MPGRRHQRTDPAGHHAGTVLEAGSAVYLALRHQSAPATHQAPRSRRREHGCRGNDRHRLGADADSRPRRARRAWLPPLHHEPGKGRPGADGGAGGLERLTARFRASRVTSVAMPWTLLVLLGLAFAPICGAQTLLDGLAGYWSFDEGSGAMVGDGSGNANNGSLVNGGSAWVPGHFGTALQFPGN